MGHLANVLQTNAALFQQSTHDYLINYFFLSLASNRMLILWWWTKKNVFAFVHFLDHWAPFMNFNSVLCEKVCCYISSGRFVFFWCDTLRLLANIKSLLANRFIMHWFYFYNVLCFLISIHCVPHLCVFSVLLDRLCFGIIRISELLFSYHFHYFFRFFSQNWTSQWSFYIIIRFSILINYFHKSFFVGNERQKIRWKIL